MDVKIETYKQCAAYINEKSTDPSIKEFVFGASDVTHKHIKKHGPIYRILFSAFSVIYTKWLSCSRNRLQAYKSAHAKNAFKLLYSLYKTQPLNLDVVVYVLSEAQKDVKEQGEQSFFFGIINENSFCPYSKLYGMIADWRRSLQAGEKTEDEILNSLVMLLESSRWLENTSWSEDENSFIHQGSIQPCGDFIYVDENKIEYVLINRSYMSKQIKRQYMSLEDFADKTIID
ncbi:MAG: hypothetical protein IKB27_01350 [Clostridia bacterium]|nr:hypothetical protein [Clostridia bacterium]